MLKLASASTSADTTNTTAVPVQARAPSQAKGASLPYVDPLDDDHQSDAKMIISHRQLARLALIAAETGSRFERERSEADPLAWLYSPRELFDGLPAILACQERASFLRAVILHSLSIGLDADPHEIDRLLADDEQNDVDDDLCCRPAPTPRRRNGHRTRMSVA